MRALTFACRAYLSMFCFLESWRSRTRLFVDGLYCLLGVLYSVSDGNRNRKPCSHWPQIAVQVDGNAVTRILLINATASTRVGSIARGALTNQRAIKLCHFEETQAVHRFGPGQAIVSRRRCVEDIDLASTGPPADCSNPSCGYFLQMRVEMASAGRSPSVRTRVISRQELRNDRD